MIFIFLPLGEVYNFALAKGRSPDRQHEGGKEENPYSPSLSLLGRKRSKRTYFYLYPHSTLMAEWGLFFAPLVSRMRREGLGVSQIFFFSTSKPISLLPHHQSPHGQW